jgi:glycosyltransferase involved in cell wall biosynthesis
VTVVNFAATNNYVIDDINVITLTTFMKIKDSTNFDILISHAPNIRNHYRFVKKHRKHFQKMVFIFHGHEVLRLSKLYPKPFFWKKKHSLIRKSLQDTYDSIKLRLWRNFFPKIKNKTHFVFVSEWMHREFLENTRIPSKFIEDRYSIIYNSVGIEFENHAYSPAENIEYDFITIRMTLDGEKYSIDIVNELAKNNPDLKFLVIGRGEIFNHIEKANNLTWINNNLNHEEMLYYLNRAKCALMPTRTDAQGLLMCEMATFGVPVITSDIPVCHEVFSGFTNVEFINNNKVNTNLSPLLNKLTIGVPYKRNEKFISKNTSGMEFKLFEKLISE